MSLAPIPVRKVPCCQSARPGSPTDITHLQDACGWHCRMLSQAFTDGSPEGEDDGEGEDPGVLIVLQGQYTKHKFQMRQISYSRI